MLVFELVFLYNIIFFIISSFYEKEGLMNGKKRKKKKKKERKRKKKEKEKR